MRIETVPLNTIEFENAVWGREHWHPTTMGPVEMDLSTVLRHDPNALVTSPSFVRYEVILRMAFTAPVPNDGDSWWRFETEDLTFHMRLAKVEWRAPAGVVPYWRGDDPGAWVTQTEPFGNDGIHMHMHVGPCDTNPPCPALP